MCPPSRKYYIGLLISGLMPYFPKLLGIVDFQNYFVRVGTAIVEVFGNEICVLLGSIRLPSSVVFKVSTNFVCPCFNIYARLDSNEMPCSSLAN